MSSFLRTLCVLVSLLPIPLYADGLVDRLGELLPGSTSSPSNEILDPDVAFRVSADIGANNQLFLNWEIEDGYYLYKDKFSVNTENTEISIGNTNFPAGKLKEDPLFGKVEVYYGQSSAPISLSVLNPSLNEFQLNVGYQGCKEDSICYPPIKKSFNIALPTTFQVTTGTTSVNTLQISEQDAITQKLKDKNLLINILTFFGFGFLLALTPCVFPMIPILSGIIVGEGERITRTRAITLSISYVLAMALTYSVLGILAGMFNLNLQAASQNIWVLSLFSAVFVALALSMFGFYELQLPSSLQSKISAGQDRAKQGTLKGAAIMGVLSAIIVGPCVAPPLAGALLYISQTGDAVLGGLALFAMGLGFGVPLLVVGATSGELLPRAGAWMETIKRSFGVIMLGVAIWFLERVFPAGFVLGLWAALFITTAIFIGALDRMESTTTAWQRLCKGLGLVVLVYGIVLIVAAAYGGGTVLKPFKQGSVFQSETQKQLPFTYISSLQELDEQLRLAANDNKMVMLDFYADWCIDCKQMEAYTFTDANVQQTLQQLVLLKADVTENNDLDKELLKHFDLFGPPAILFFNAQSNEIKSHRLVGFVKADRFVEHVNQALAL